MFYQDCLHQIKIKTYFLLTVVERQFMFRFVHSLSVDEREGIGEDPSVDYGSSQEFVAAIWWKSDGKAKICLFIKLKF